MGIVTSGIVVYGVVTILTGGSISSAMILGLSSAGLFLVILGAIGLLRGHGRG
jgi:hypothetical protein